MTNNYMLTAEKTVAGTILAQLGGSRFLAMTGAKNLLAGENELHMRLGRNPGRITHLRVRLHADDTYAVDFLRWSTRTMECKVVSFYAGIHCDQLAQLVTEHTGLATRL